MGLPPNIFGQMHEQVCVTCHMCVNTAASIHMRVTAVGCAHNMLIYNTLPTFGWRDRSSNTRIRASSV